MRQFRMLGDYALTTGEQLACQVLCGLWPAVDLTVVQDMMANKDAGFSFVSHPANSLATAYKALLQVAVTSHHYQVVRGNKWSKVGVVRYTKEVQALERMLLLGLYTTCGQARRAEDLLSVPWQNKAGWARGVYV